MFTIIPEKSQSVQMDAQQVIQWYDWLLFLSGGKLYLTNDIVFYTNWTLKLLNALAYLFMMFADSMAPSAFNFSEASVVQWLADKANALLALAFSVTLTYYGGRVTLLLEECLTLVDDAGRKKIHYTATGLSILSFMCVIGTAITGIVLDMNDVSKHGATLDLVVGAVLSGFISLNSWFNNAMILYVIFVYTLTKREENQLTKMAISLTTPAKLESNLVQQLLSQRKHLHHLIAEVNRLVGFCPLFMFGFMFILTPAIITDIRDDEDVVGVVMLILFLLISFAAIAVLLFFVSRFLLNSEILSREVTERAYNLKDYDIRCQDLIREVSVSNIRLTAWSLFQINPQSFLSFTAAVFTFTVLFIQLNIKSLKQVVSVKNPSNST